MLAGRSARAAWIDASTSCAALSMSTDRSNWMVMRVWFCVLCDVISVTPAMVPRWRSSGVATESATSLGEPPGCVACTWITGKATLGSGATGSLV